MDHLLNKYYERRPFLVKTLNKNYKYIYIIITNTTRVTASLYSKIKYGEAVLRITKGIIPMYNGNKMRTRHYKSTV